MQLKSFLWPSLIFIAFNKVHCAESKHESELAFTTKNLKESVKILREVLPMDLLPPLIQAKDLPANLYPTEELKEEAGRELQLANSIRNLLLATSESSLKNLANVLTQEKKTFLVKFSTVWNWLLDSLRAGYQKGRLHSGKLLKGVDFYSFLYSTVNKPLIPILSLPPDNAPSDLQALKTIFANYELKSPLLVLASMHKTDSQFVPVLPVGKAILKASYKFRLEQEPGFFFDASVYVDQHWEASYKSEREARKKAAEDAKKAAEDFKKAEKAKKDASLKAYKRSIFE